MEKLIHPILFNIITIAALLLCLTQVITSPDRTMSATSEAIQILVNHAEENEVAGETLRLATDQEWRRGFNNKMILTAVVAVLANVIANYLGRSRHRANLDRIRNLEATLRGLRSRRP